MDDKNTANVMAIAYVTLTACC